jgi:hypothetical protein
MLKIKGYGFTKLFSRYLCYMDKKLEILLGSERSTKSVNVQEFDKAELTRKTSELTEFTVNDVVDATDVFDRERENNPVYRIYGRIEYLSLLNGLVNDYNELDDFFTPVYTGNSKNILNSFDFYLVKPANSGYTRAGSINSGNHLRVFQVIATPSEFELFRAGFTTNVYDEQTYGFAFNTDFDVSKYFDNFGFPVTELFLFVQYKLKTNGNGVAETMQYTRYTTTGTTIKTNYIPKTLGIGDFVETATSDKIGELINYNQSQYSQTLVENQTVYIKTQYSTSGGSTRYLIWKHKPFIPFRLRYLSDDLSTSEMTKLTENSIDLDVVFTGNTGVTSSIKKSDQQIIGSDTTPIQDWTSIENNTGGAVTANLSNGTFIFGFVGDYELKFSARIRFPQNSYKHYAVIKIQKQNGGTWVDISGSTILFENSYEQKTVTITKNFIFGDTIRIVTRLIPNPNELVPEETEIPEYATELSNGQYVWREIVPQGFTEPLSGNGVDYPFMNGRRYLFAPLILSISPDLDDDDNGHNTRDRFAEISMNNNYTLLEFNPEPENDLNDIGKPCQ